MGLTKTDIFSKSQNNLAEVCKVLGHPARIAILEHISNTNSCICGDLVEEIGLAQATISQHLRELKKINLIQGTIEGTSVCYCINQQNWQKIAFLISKFLNQKIHSDIDCC